ncbi:putative P-loop containing nucleoside triphosphate hydrolase, leucine-rich repeat domain, L [Medicago truncatula]|uniref:LRR and NB-ARC domain disease resistance protein n=1 Tax=Medicago truncatula TaxID=3880 RepID=G7KKM2_MEDTR|nr:putative disease resistance protein RGA1 isoform X1 [Medicago truncatula]AES75558.1 LRR and NB-ARC domain disease resistance protein [Medicago truncatula]RHN51412.1 putative P-loop containing nucleoside triphosphate hydrolase, leucine-rich repeat domain, L [Medicago truncatula]
MADALLGIVIENLGYFVREELASFLGVEKLTQKLNENLTTIRAVLKDAQKKQITSNVVKQWLQKLSDAAYVLDDILDECSITSKAHGDNTSFHPMKILAHRNIGKRMKKVAKKIDDIAEERIKFGFQQVGVMEEHQRGDDEWRQTISTITEPKVYGRDKDKEQIVEFLLRHASDSEKLSVYSIVGHGGYGKTALAQMVFNDESVKTHFDLKIWVCVSDDFSMMKVLESIIENTIGKNPHLSSLESMQKNVQEILQNKRYLLVLDDVWTEDREKWNKFKSVLQNRTKGASVLVTTRLDNVASIMGTYPAHPLVGLSDDHIWSLFKQQAFGENGEERAELVEIGKKLVRKFVGSPLAAKVLGSSLQRETDEHQWISVLESEIWNLPEDDPIISALRLSYFNMKLSLRPCFTFCAVFPKDFEMVKEDLIHLWMANGLVTSRGNLQMEHVGDEVWNQLWQRSFFQEVKSDLTGNITFKMHDFIHDLAQSIMGEECISYDVSKLTNLSIRVHHMSLFDKKSKHDYMIPCQKVDSLRTFLEYKQPSKNLNALLSKTPLRALHTSSHQLSSLKSLMHLRYLKLSSCDITTLPGSVCRLQKLQTLKLEDCVFLSSFPKQFTKLKDLRHLMIKDCPSLISTPFRIRELTCLKTLTNFIVGLETGFGLAELHNLQLGGKLYIKGLENVSNKEDAKEANLIGKKDLNSLYLSWGDDANSQVGGVDVEVLEALEPHSGLKHFGVNGYGGTDFPHWMKNTSILKGLVSIILFGCKNCRQLPPFGKLPCLTTLFISEMRDLKYIDDDLYEPATDKVFTSLKKLTLYNLQNLKRVLKVEGVEMLTQLLELDITKASKFTFPSLPSVESLSVQGGNEDLFKFIGYNKRREEVAYSSSRGIVGYNMSNLKSLRISGFNRHDLLVKLCTLSALESLEIDSCNGVESFSALLLIGLRSLRTLSISSCDRFKSMSEGIRYLTCLETLEISNCPQFVFPHNMNSLTSLRLLHLWDLGDNENILDGIEGIPSLQKLSLMDFPLVTALPDCLGAMTSLQELYIIDFPKLSSLPDSFQQLRNLQKLIIIDCPMLEKRYKRGCEDQHKIAHIPEFYFESGAKPTFPENIISAWETYNQKIYYPLSGFEKMIDSTDLSTKDIDIEYGKYTR